MAASSLISWTRFKVFILLTNTAKFLANSVQKLILASNTAKKITPANQGARFRKYIMAAPYNLCERVVLFLALFVYLY